MCMALLLKEALKSTGMESELIFLSDLTIGFCTGCLSCRDNKGICPKDDDMRVLLDQSISSKAIVLGSPNYYYDISDLTKNMIDRFNIRYPFVTGDPCFSVSDTAWRVFGGLGRDELTYTFPYPKLMEIADQIKPTADYINSYDPAL